MPSVFSSNWIVLVLLWIKDLFSRITESQTLHLAVDHTLFYQPEIPSGSQQLPVVESQHSATNTRDVLVENVAFSLIKKANDEKCQLILENQELGSLVTNLKNELDTLHLKHTELQSKHDEFVLLYHHEKRCELDMIKARSEEMIEKGRIREELSAKVVELESAICQLETQNQVILEMKEKQLRLMNDDSRLRKSLEKKDRLLASKESVLGYLKLHFEEQAKLILHLLGQLPELDCMKDEGLQQLVSAKHNDVSQQTYTKITADVGCGCDKSVQFPEPISIQEPLLPELIPAEISITEQQIEKKFSLPEAEVSTSIVLEELTVNQPGVVEPFQPSEASPTTQPECIVWSDIITTDAGCGCDESTQFPEPNSIPLAPEVISAEISIPEPEIESKISLPEAEVNSTDLTAILLGELTVNNQTTVVEPSQPSEAPPTNQQEFIVRSDVTTESFSSYMIVKGIPTENIGRVIGRQGSNMRRLERGYGVKLSFIKGILHITGGDCERRRAVAKIIIDSLPIVIECPLLPLANHSKLPNLLLSQMSFKYDVQIYRPSEQDKHGIIWGTIDRCRTVYHLLKNASK